MISESGHTTHSRHVENPYLGFLFRCYSDSGKRGRQPDNSVEEDQETVRGTVSPTNAIQTCLTRKVLFGMALRQIEPWKRHWSE